MTYMNNECLKFYMNNEVYHQFTNPFTYTKHLNFIDCPWSLICSPSYFPVQTNKRKKIRDQIPYERSIKEANNAIHPSKHEVIEWLKSLPKDKIYDIFSVENAWLAIVIIKMYQRYCSQRDIVFALLFEENKKVKDGKNVYDFGELENHFYCRKQQVNEFNGSNEKRQAFQKAEEELIKSIRIADHNDFYDTILLDEKLIDNFDRLLEIFDIISDQHVFSKPYKQKWDYYIKSNTTWDAPWWFNPNSFQTLASWIVSTFEKVIWIQYYEKKKNNNINNNTSNSNGTSTSSSSNNNGNVNNNIHRYDIAQMDQIGPKKMTLSYKHEMLAFWRNLEKIKKKRLLRSLIEILQSFDNYMKKEPLNLTNSNNILQQLLQCKEDNNTNNKKLAFLCYTYKNPEKNFNYHNQFESISRFYYNMLEDNQDEKLIDHILFTSLDQFANLTNLVSRGLAIKLKKLYSQQQQITIESDGNDETDQFEKKKCTKKKKNKKKKAISEFNSSTTSIILNTLILPLKSSFFKKKTKSGVVINTPKTDDDYPLKTSTNLDISKNCLDTLSLESSLNTTTITQSDHNDLIMNQGTTTEVTTTTLIEMKEIMHEEGVGLGLGGSDSVKSYQTPKNNDEQGKDDVMKWCREVVMKIVMESTSPSAMSKSNPFNNNNQSQSGLEIGIEAITGLELGISSSSLPFLSPIKSGLTLDQISIEIIPTKVSSSSLIINNSNQEKLIEATSMTIPTAIRGGDGARERGDEGEGGGEGTGRGEIEGIGRREDEGERRGIEGRGSIGNNSGNKSLKKKKKRKNTSKDYNMNSRTIAKSKQMDDKALAERNNRPDESETTRDTKSYDTKSITDTADNNGLNIDDIHIFDEFDTGNNNTNNTNKLSSCAKKRRSNNNNSNNKKLKTPSTTPIKVNNSTMVSNIQPNERMIRNSDSNMDNSIKQAKISQYKSLKSQENTHILDANKDKGKAICKKEHRPNEKAKPSQLNAKDKVNYAMETTKNSTMHKDEYNRIKTITEKFHKIYLEGQNFDSNDNLAGGCESTKNLLNNTNKLIDNPQIDPIIIPSSTSLTTTTTTSITTFDETNTNTMQDFIEVKPRRKGKGLIMPRKISQNKEKKRENMFINGNKQQKEKSYIEKDGLKRIKRQELTCGNSGNGGGGASGVSGVSGISGSGGFNANGNGKKDNVEGKMIKNVDGNEKMQLQESQLTKRDHHHTDSKPSQSQSQAQAQASKYMKSQKILYQYCAPEAKVIQSSNKIFKTNLINNDKMEIKHVIVVDKMPSVNSGKVNNQQPKSTQPSDSRSTLSSINPKSNTKEPESKHFPIEPNLTSLHSSNTNNNTDNKPSQDLLKLTTCTKSIPSSSSTSISTSTSSSSSSSSNSQQAMNSSVLNLNLISPEKNTQNGNGVNTIMHSLSSSLLSVTNTPSSTSSSSCSPQKNGVCQSDKLKQLTEKLFKKKLENDIIRHVAILTEESNKIMDYRIIAFKRLEYVIPKCFLSAKVKTTLFGSCATGLALKTSDVDISISGLDAIDNTQIINALKIIHQKLQYFKWIKSSKPIYTASIPVLKLEINPTILFNELTLTDNNNGDYIIQNLIENHHIIQQDLNLSLMNPEDFTIRIDLSVESYYFINQIAHLGHLTTQYIQNMLNAFPSLYAMTMIFKNYLQKRNLLNVYQGGISSYCLILMIIAYYKKFNEIDYPNDLMNFLRFYGCEFDPNNTGISLLKEHEPFFPLKKDGFCCNNFMLFDTINLGKNLGSASFNINLILSEFNKSIFKLEQYKVKFEEKFKDIYSKANNIITFEDLELILTTHQDNIDFKSLMDLNLIEMILF